LDKKDFDDTLDCLIRCGLQIAKRMKFDNENADKENHIILVDNENPEKLSAISGFIESVLKVKKNYFES